ncbi:CCR4-Not complex component, Not1-domain-containing protein [Myxozyma melibiosi]|uniref:CCR4-Not complex component, Not1-domain-containing protein n=1 Tax=Myxozyma melibiosi TaxID=54550 RepID=A0ABR1FEX5_9ASCO
MESLQKLIASLGPNIQQSIDDLAYDSKTLIAVANAAIESNLVDELTSFQPYFFTLDVFSHLARAGKYPLQKYLDQNLTNDSPAFVSAVLTFLDLKSSAEYSQQQQQQQQEEQIPEPADFLSLHVQVVHDLLHVLLSRTIPLEFVDKWEHVQAKCIQTYPRLINLGSGHDSAVLANSNETGFSAEVEKRMKYYYQRMYEQEMSISDVITLLQELKVSDDPNEQDAFSCMVHSLFDEYRFFPDYPLPALATTAVLFGSIIQFHLIEDLPLAVALRFVLEALKEPPDAKMFKFGLQALMQFQSRLDTFPHYCTLLLQIPSLEAVQPQLIAKLRALIMKDGNSLGGNGAIDQSIDNDAPPPPPPFRSLHLDSDSAGPSETASEDPNEDVQDKVLFIVNNLAPTNVEQKSRELKSVLEEKYYQWFATYLVDTRAKQEPNFHDLYMKMLDIVNDNHLNKQIISSTYASIIAILNSSDTAISAQERGRLKNLGCWLGYLTLARDKPIKHKNIAFKDLLIEAFDTNRLTVVLPFVCKVLEMVTKSRIFKPPSPWVMGILKVMAELYQFAELKLNLKFEIEVLCNSLGVELNSLEPSTILRERPLKTEAIDNAARPAGIDVNRDFDRLSLSGYNRVDGRLSVRPSDGINIGTPSLPTSYPQTSAGGALTTHPAMKKILQTAIEKSIRELITPVVERSDTIAQIATKELTTKDFALEGDEEKLRKAAHNMVHYLASSLALVTCKEPLRINIGTNLRALLVASGYPESSFSPEVLNATINEHLDAACAVIQKAAVDKAIADIDEVLAPAYAVRRRHRELRPNQPFIEQSASRYALQLPDPFRLKPPGLTRQQLMVYEDFGKFKLGGLGPDGLQVGEFGAAVDHAGAPLASQAYLLQQQQQTQNALLGQSQNLVQQQQQQSIGMAAHGQPQNRLMPVLQQQGSQQPGHQFDGQLHGPQTPTQPPVETVGGMGDISRMSATGKMSAIEQTLASMQTAIDAMIKTIKELPDGSYEKLPADSRVKAMVNSILSVANRSPLRDQIILRTSQLTVSVLFTVADSQLAREALGYLLARLCDLSAATSKEVVLWLILSEDERKFNVPVMITLMRLGLVHPQELDLNLAKQLTAHRLPAIEFIANLIHEALLGENPCALRTDFSLCLEAMEMLASEEQPEQIAIQLIQALENAALPALPGSDITEKEMMRYIFNEWVRLIQHPAQSEKLLNVFILQLAEKGILDDDKYLGVFFRNALEFCIDAYAKDLQLRMMNNAVSTKEGVISVDALAKLTVMLFKIHDEQGETRKIVYLRSILSVHALVFAQNHESQGEGFNGQPFFRLFSSIMCEFVEIGETMSEHKEEFYTLMAEIFKALQPVAFPGFTFAWMTLISHRMFMPKILQLEQKKGWKSFAELIELLLKFIGLHVVGSDLPESIRYIYKGTLRIVLVLLHDIPEFLVQYHYTLCNAVPICCVQLRNLILSAFPQSMALPDPFAQGFRIETLAECKQEPVLAVDPAEDLRTFGMLEFVNGYLRSKNASGISLKPLLEVLTTKSRTEIGLGFKTVSTNTQAMNALVLYVGQQAVAEMISKSSGEEAVVFDGKTNYVSFLTSLVLELGPEGRFFLLSAMANQLRYPNSHTFYFTSLIQHLYETAALGGQQQDIQEHIARVVLERLLCHRPHPVMGPPHCAGRMPIRCTAASAGAD